MSTARRRLLAGLIDLGLMLAWALVVAGLGWVLLSNGLLRGIGPLVLNLFGIALVVLPVTIGLTLLEGGRLEATPGKLKLGLRVRKDPSGEGIGWRRSLLRNLLKFGLPWALLQLAIPAVLARGGPLGWIGLAIAVAVPVSYLVTLLLGSGRTVYDQIAGTMVISTAPGRRFAD